MIVTRDVLISGASIAGPTLAYWLDRYGFADGRRAFPRPATRLGRSRDRPVRPCRGRDRVDGFGPGGDESPHEDRAVKPHARARSTSSATRSARWSRNRTRSSAPSRTPALAGSTSWSAPTACTPTCETSSSVPRRSSAGTSVATSGSSPCPSTSRWTGRCGAMWRPGSLLRYIPYARPEMRGPGSSSDARRS